MNTKKQNIKKLLGELLTLEVNLPSSSKEKYILKYYINQMLKGTDLKYLLDSIKQNIKTGDKKEKIFYSHILTIILKGANVQWKE